MFPGKASTAVDKVCLELPAAFNFCQEIKFYMRKRERAALSWAA